MSLPILARKLLVALAAPLVFLGVLELALYLADFSHRPVETPIVIWNPIADRELDDQAGLFQSDPWSLWSPRPGASIPWGEAERVNAAGFRGPELTLERAPGVLRVAVLGDSSTFGVHLPYGEGYGAQLERLLEDEGVRAEVLNAGVVGFTLAQGLARYRHHVRPYRPDVVVAAFGAVNDHHAAVESDVLKIERSQRSHAREARAPWLKPERVRVLQLASYLVYGLRGGFEGQRERYVALQRRTSGIASTVGRADWEGTRRVSLEPFRALVRELAREVERDGATLVVLVMPRDHPAEADLPVLARYSQILKEVAAGEGLPLCDGRQAFREAAAADGEGAKPLFIPGDRWHPSERGHALLARELLPLVRAAAGARAGS